MASHKHIIKRHIVHIIPAHPLFYSMTEFWANEFPDFNVEVFLLKKTSDRNEYLFKSNSVSVVEYSGSRDLAKKMLNIINNSEIVYIHAIFFTFFTKLWLLLLGRTKWIKKVVWIEWGFDLYYWDSSSLLNIVKSHLKQISVKFVEKRFPFFVAIHPADIRSYKKIINGKAKLFFAPYTNERSVSHILIDHIKETISSKILKGEPIVIQIGHRADHILNHIDTLYKLERFAKENIRIFLPLSYGDEPYRKKVIETANKLFGEKAICQTVNLPYDEYIARLKSVDIFILNSERQIALGNLHPMIIMEKKIIMPQSSVLYDYLKSFTPIMTYGELDRCSFEYLISDVDMKESRKRIIEYRSLNPVECWNKVFHDISDSQIYEK